MRLILIFLIFILFVIYFFDKIKKEKFEELPDEIVRWKDSDNLSSKNNYNSELSRNMNIVNDNSYLDLWETNNDPIKKKTDCIEYELINDCMDKCTSMDNCIGFTMKNNRCCMRLLDKKRSTNDLLYPDINYALSEFNGLLLNDYDYKFDMIRNENTYRSNISKSECNKFCPKCVMGYCPTNYRCEKMLKDPRYNDSCIIVNNKNN